MILTSASSDPVPFHLELEDKVQLFELGLVQYQKLSPEIELTPAGQVVATLIKELWDSNIVKVQLEKDLFHALYKSV